MFLGQKKLPPTAKKYILNRNQAFNGRGNGRQRALVVKMAFDGFLLGGNGWGQWTMAAMDDAGNTTGKVAAVTDKDTMAKGGSSKDSV